MSGCPLNAIIAYMAKPLIKLNPFSRGGMGYFDLSREPLYMLVFLLPLIVFYEVALYFAYIDEHSNNIQIKAHDNLVRFLEYFDMPPTQGLGLGGIVIISILLLWHIINAQKWTIKFRVIVYMAIESVLLAIPLLIFGAFLGGLVASTNDSSIGNLMPYEKLAVSIGAGLYEELVFRMIIIGFVHTVLCGIFKQSDRSGIIVGVLVSAVIFALYHDLPDAGSLSALTLFFIFSAGVYLGILYVSRGFGIVAATHAAYDVVATIDLASIAT